MTTIAEASIRLLDRLETQGALCLDCGEETQDSKPYCPAHVHLMPYVTDLLAHLGRQQSESAA